MNEVRINFEDAFSAIYSVAKLYASGKTSSGHSYVIAEVPSLGKTIFLDDTLESSLLDEFIYHETLIHPAISLLESGSRVGLIGGFEGSSLREILRRNSISEISLLDDDKELLAIGKTYLSDWGKGVAVTPKVRVDEEHNGKYNCLIFDFSNRLSIDSTRAISAIEKRMTSLEAGGVIALNGGPASIFSTDRIQELKTHLEKHFLHVEILTFPMRSCMGLWSVLIASSREIKLKKEEFESSIRKDGLAPKFLTSVMYDNVFTPPDYLLTEQAGKVGFPRGGKSLTEVTESITDGITASYKAREILQEGKTPYQKYSIINLDALGKTLFIEPQLQSALVDEYIYHECLVHPAMTLSPNPKRVMIAGGGEGATLRDVLKHPSISEAYMIDIDAEIVTMSNKHLPEWHQGAFDDERAIVECTDARKWIESAPKSSFDVIISDLSEPVDGGPSAFLFTVEFFRSVFDALTNEGIFVLQAGTADIAQPECFACCAKTLKAVFPIVRPYQAHVTSFLGPWAYVLASKVHDPLSLSQKELGARLGARGVATRYYTPRMHPRIFDIPPYLEDEIQNRARVLTDTAPYKW